MIRKGNLSEYFEWGGSFSSVYLEDSFVTNISKSETELVFDIELVLTEKHPLFSKPRAGEQYCYRKGRLVFSGISVVNWRNKSATFYIDANGEKDYGNIDSLRKYGDDIYNLSGDWGYLEITSSHLDITFC